METFMMIAVPLTIFVVAAALGSYLVKAGQKILLIVLASVWAAITASLVVGMENAQGWDALGYFIGLIGLSAPSGLGLLIGAVIGWVRKRDVDTNAVT